MQNNVDSNYCIENAIDRKDLKSFLWLLENNVAVESDLFLRHKDNLEFYQPLIDHLSNEQIASTLAIGPASKMISLEDVDTVFQILKSRGALPQLCYLKIDAAGNTVLHNTNHYSLIEKIINEGLLPSEPVLNNKKLNAAEWQACQGKYILAESLAKNHYTIDSDIKILLIKTIEHGIQKSSDRNKLRALKALAKKHNISIGETNLNNLYKSLTEHYLEQTSPSENPDCDKLMLMSKTMQSLDEDWSREILSYTKRYKNFYGDAVTAYRGMYDGGFTDNYMQSLFKFGFKSLGDAGNNLFTSTTVETRDQSNESIFNWEVRGAFLSTDLSQSLKYALNSNYNAAKTAARYFMEIDIDDKQARIHGTAFESGYNKSQELIVNQIYPHSIRHIYKLDENGTVIDYFNNPSYIPLQNKNDLSAKVEIGDNIIQKILTPSTSQGMNINI